MIDKRRPHGLPLIGEGKRPGHPGGPAFSDLVQPEKMWRTSGTVRYIPSDTIHTYLTQRTVVSVLSHREINYFDKTKCHQRFKLVGIRTYEHWGGLSLKGSRYLRRL